MRDMPAAAFYVRFWALAVLGLVIVSCRSASQPSTRARHFPFHGIVVSLDPQAHTAHIRGDKVEGWMDAMTMDYPVPSPEDFTKLTAGQQVEATVDVQGTDYALSHVRESAAK